MYTGMLAETPEGVNVDLVNPLYAAISTEYGKGLQDICMECTTAWLLGLDNAAGMLFRDGKTIYCIYIHVTFALRLVANARHFDFH